VCLGLVGVDEVTQRALRLKLASATSDEVGERQKTLVGRSGYPPLEAGHG
jgi:hypothetical protein